MRFSERMGELVRRLLSCCDRDDERPALSISAPTNFRREDVSITGLSEMQQTYIREIAKEDAKQMYENLQPLRSSPSGDFAVRPTPPAYEELSPARSPRSPMLSGARMEARLNRMKAHSRRLSDALSKPLGFSLIEHDDCKHETKALMDDHTFLSISPAKLSSESFYTGSDEDKFFRNKF